jgi:hypothetical protein
VSFNVFESRFNSRYFTACFLITSSAGPARKLLLFLPENRKKLRLGKQGRSRLNQGGFAF